MFDKLMFRMSLALLLGLFAAGADARLSSALITYYPLDGDARDATGNGHDGTIMSDPQTIPGMFGQALEFDGVDDYVLVTDYVPVSGAADRAVTAWVRMVSTDVQGIIAWGQIAGQSKWVIRLSTKGQLRLEIEGAAIKGNSRLADGEWHHIAVSFANDGTPALGDVDLYADGTLQNHANEALQINTSPTGNLEIGRNLKNDGFFEGTIDEVKIYDRALSEDEVFEDMEGPPSYSFTDNPIPSDGAVDVPRNTVLSWTPSKSANTHDVYFGTNPDDVSEADRTNPLGVLKSQNQDANSYDPLGLLDFGQTYYWRVDEINAPPDLTVFKGDVWQFTVEPFAYPVKNITATASSNTPDRGPENTVNGSGLDESGLLHDKIADGAMWLSSLTEDQPTWIHYEFDKVHKLHEMWVWNFNDSLEPIIGSGFKDATIEYSVDGIDYITFGTTHEFAQAPGMPDYAHNTTIAFGGFPAKCVRLTAISNWGNILTQYGLSEVRFFSIPVQARQPYPASGTTGVDPDVTLSWTAGREAVAHDVYLSTDPQAVADGTALVSKGTQTNYGPLSLYLGTTYYWRIDEVNDAEMPTVWRGDIWEFTTHEFLVVDNFESYTDDDAAGQAIWQHWIDGFDMPGNGSQVGNLLPPYAEQTIVHGGGQSMPLHYNNTGGVMNSEAALTLIAQRDWTRHGLTHLSLWFRGYPGSVGSFVEAPAGTYTMTASGADIAGTADQFHYAFKTLTGPGVIVARVNSVENTHQWAKAGVMIRETLEAGSKYAFVCVTPENGVAFQRRTDTDAASASTNETGITAPHWVKLERDAAGNFMVSHSTNGTSWQSVAGTIPMNIPMTSNIYIGLALTSHDAALTSQAVFSNVTMTGNVGEQWAHQDVGITSNAVEPMYVALSNANGASAVVAHEDPAAATIEEWTEWRILLQVFADQGVNLTDVDKIAIGLGTKAGVASSGGLGTMYFDDIRLYRSEPQP